MNKCPLPAKQHLLIHALTHDEQMLHSPLNNTYSFTHLLTMNKCPLAVKQHLLIHALTHDEQMPTRR